jgi:hypothetical protein
MLCWWALIYKKNFGFMLFFFQIECAIITFYKIVLATRLFNRLVMISSTLAASLSNNFLSL